MQNDPKPLLDLEIVPKTMPDRRGTLGIFAAPGVPGYAWIAVSTMYKDDVHAGAFLLLTDEELARVRAWIESYQRASQEAGDAK